MAFRRMTTAARVDATPEENGSDRGAKTGSGGKPVNSPRKYDDGQSEKGSSSPSSEDTSFATEGNLRKQGNQKLVKDWKMRYFVLTDMGSLLYYKQKGEAQPLGIIKVQKAKTRLAPETGKDYAFCVDTGDRVFRMQAASAQEMGRWIDCINRAGGHVNRTSGFSESAMSSREVQKTTAVVRSVTGGGSSGSNGASGSSGSLTSSNGSSSSRSGKSGYLMKMGNNVRGKSDWKQRWFVLERDNLRYYPTEQSDELLGTIKLVTASAGGSDLRERCIQIITPNRKYYVQAPTEQDASEWIQQINVARDVSGNSSVAASTSEEGVDRVLSGMLKKMGNNKIKDWRERYCVVNATTFRYYKNDKSPTALGEVNLLMASAKDEGSNRFSLVLPQRKYVFECKNVAELQKWMKGIQDATTNLYNNLKAGESSKKKDSKDVSKFAENKQRVLDLMRSVPGNQLCADCGKPNPRWASVNLGVFICLECSGIHRSLGVHISKVRSADLDEWEDWQLDAMSSKGNQLQNEIYEWKGVNEVKPGPESSAIERDRYIRQKWAVCAFADPSRVEKGSDFRASAVVPQRLYREGFLTKQGHKRKNWKKRWFVLKESELCYYENRGAEEPNGRIALDDPTVAVQAMSGGPFPFMFELLIGDVSYLIYAQDEKERYEWIDVIERVIQKYGNLDDDDDDGSVETATAASVAQTEDDDEDLLVVPSSDAASLDGQAIFNGPRDMEGVLHKMGELFWKTAYFILCQSDLYYFRSNTMEIAGVVALRGSTIKVVAKRPDRSNCFLVITTEKALLFSADSPEMQKSWMDVLAAASSKPGRAQRALSLGLDGMQANSPPSLPQAVPTKRLPELKQSANNNSLAKSSDSAVPMSRPVVSPRPLSVDMKQSGPVVSPGRKPPAGSVSVMPAQQPGGVALKKAIKKAPLPPYTPPSKSTPAKATAPSPPKKPLPGAPPKKPVPTLAAAPAFTAANDAKGLSSSGFGLLSLNVPDDVELSSSGEDDNPYAAYAVSAPNPEDDLIY